MMFLKGITRISRFCYNRYRWISSSVRIDRQFQMLQRSPQIGSPNQVLLLMATALNVPVPRPTPEPSGVNLSSELRLRQRSIAEITEMIHVA